MYFHSASLREPNKTEMYSFVPLKAEPHAQEEEGSKKKKKDLTDCTAVSIQFAVLFLKSPALAIILSWGWWGRAADNLLCVCVCVYVGDRGVEHTHTGPLHLCPL